MDIVVVGLGYVGLVTSVSLAEIGYKVVGFDVDTYKVEQLNKGKSYLYEPGLEELIYKNISNNRLTFTTDEEKAYKMADIIFIAVGTPSKKDGSSDLSFFNEVLISIGKCITKDIILVIKSTVPVGTNDYVKEFLARYTNKTIHVVSNPEFLREGSALHDTFNGDRIVIGTSSKFAVNTMIDIYKQFNIPIFVTDNRSAEMIKYASNAFLATKISFVNEISNLCDRLGANVDDVAKGMGMDKRIGSQFLKAGIGFGGSCFPKDTQALMHIAYNVEYHFQILERVIQINSKQRMWIIRKAKEIFSSFKGIKIAFLGLSFKPNTDDIRDSPAIEIAKELVEEGAIVKVFDPIAITNAKKVLHDRVLYSYSLNEALNDTDCAMILTDWDIIKNIPIKRFIQLMKKPIIIDGRNCFELSKVKRYCIDYYSVGRPDIVEGEVKTE